MKGKVENGVRGVITIIVVLFAFYKHGIGHLK